MSLSINIMRGKAVEALQEAHNPESAEDVILYAQTLKKMFKVEEKISRLNSTFRLLADTQALSSEQKEDMKRVRIEARWERHDEKMSRERCGRCGR